MGGRLPPPPRSRLQSYLSDDEDRERGRERRPAAYRRFNEVESLRPRGGESTSSGEEKEYRPRLSNVAKLREQDARRRQEEEREEDDDVEQVGTRAWGFSKELQVREVSAKDGRGR